MPQGPRFAHSLESLRTTWSIDLGRGLRSVVYLAGTCRSGTTWLAELINYRNEFRVIFEPFHHVHGPFPGRFTTRYVRPDDRDEARHRIVERVLRGRVRHAWSGGHNRAIVARRRLIKDIYSNLMLGWFRAAFPAFPIVLIIRHPCAVAHSNMRVQFPSELEFYRRQPELAEDYLDGLLPEIERARDTYEEFLYRWCIETYVPLTQFRGSDDVCVLFYEELALHPRKELERVAAYTGVPFRAEMVERAGRSSRTTWRSERERLQRAKDAVSAWRRDLTPQQVSRAEEILSLFGLEHLYGPDGLPQAAVPLEAV